VCDQTQRTGAVFFLTLHISLLSEVVAWTEIFTLKHGLYNTNTDFCQCNYVLSHTYHVRFLPFLNSKQRTIPSYTHKFMYKRRVGLDAPPSFKVPRHERDSPNDRNRKPRKCQGPHPSPKKKPALIFTGHTILPEKICSIS
jgi:hypothetical protein